jgi:hypothetical protein
MLFRGLPRRKIHFLSPVIGAHRPAPRHAKPQSPTTGLQNINDRGGTSLRRSNAKRDSLMLEHQSSLQKRLVKNPKS